MHFLFKTKLSKKREKRGKKLHLERTFLKAAYFTALQLLRTRDETSSLPWNLWDHYLVKYSHGVKRMIFAVYTIIAIKIVITVIISVYTCVAADCNVWILISIPASKERNESMEDI